MSGELNYTVKDLRRVINAVKDRYQSEGAEDFTDGYSLETAAWRFNIRPSNTELLLRLNIETREEHLVEEIKNSIEAIISAN